MPDAVSLSTLSEMPSKRYTTIHVTQEDIDKAFKNQSARCVIATAVARSIPGASKVAVDMQSLRFTVDGERHVYFTPPGAVGYVIAFDAGDPIHPFSFRLSEDHRLPMVPARKRSAAGIARVTAGNRVRSAERAVKQAETAVEEATTPAEREVATVRFEEAGTKLEQAVEQRTAILAATADQPTESSRQGRKLPPTTFKLGSRHYGHRELRVNKADVEPAARANLLSEYERYVD